MDTKSTTEHPVYVLRTIIHKLILIEDKALQPYGITNQQARILSWLHYYLSQNTPICQKHLEEIMQLKGSSITSLVQGLERKGFIERTASAQDGRTKQLIITPKGINLLSTMKDIIQKTEEGILECLSSEEKVLFRELLSKIYHNFVINP